MPLAPERLRQPVADLGPVRLAHLEAVETERRRSGSPRRCEWRNEQVAPAAESFWHTIANQSSASFSVYGKGMRRVRS